MDAEDSVAKQKHNDGGGGIHPAPEGFIVEGERHPTSADTITCWKTACAARAGRVSGGITSHDGCYYPGLTATRTEAAS